MAAELIRGLYNLKPKHKKGVLAIGNFDGVHLGHQAIIAAVIQKAQALQAASMVMTFEPQPAEFFAGEKVKTARITRLREKFTALSHLGIDYVLVLPFNAKLAKLSASDFVSGILVEKLNIQYVITGDDFRFGKNRQGDIPLLKQWGEREHFGVETLPALLFDQERISSTRVRERLAAGDLQLAQTLLGKPYTMQGRISRGAGLGRQWGFPTANIFLHRKLTPLSGIFSVFMHGLTDQPLPGVANLGIRPTVDGTRCLLEVHLLNFNQEIYGRYVTVEFCQKFREEIRYENVALLKTQIAQDVIDAQNYFKKLGKL